MEHGIGRGNGLGGSLISLLKPDQIGSFFIQIDAGGGVTRCLCLLIQDLLRITTILALLGLSGDITDQAAIGLLISGRAIV